MTLLVEMGIITASSVFVNLPIIGIIQEAAYLLFSSFGDSLPRKVFHLHVMVQ